MKSPRILAVAAVLAVGSVVAAQEIRKPEVAGSFYPSEAKALSDSVNHFLKWPRTVYPGGDGLLGIVAPHAGYQFSGQTAGLAYSQLLGRKVRTVFVLGPSHRQSYRGIAFHHADSWETPLGRIRVDTAIEKEILGIYHPSQLLDSAFSREHSIEDQLPFIQQVLGDVHIVPIAMGAMQLSDFAALSAILSKLLESYNGTAIVIASSDMSHYKSASQTLARDSVAIKDVLTLDPDKLAADLDNGDAEFCGYGPVLTLMMVAERSGATPHFIGYSNSSQATGDTSRVVGYGAFSFTFPPVTKALDSLERRELLRIARLSLDSLIIAGHSPSIQVNDTVLLRKQGAFVTLSKNGALRGCIGYISPVTPLAQVVYNVAQSAAAKDPRFSTVKPDELKNIEVEISALGPLRRVRTLDQIVLGTTGLYIQKGQKTGILLPQVPGQFGWNREQFLQQLAVKAGLQPEDWKAPDAKIYSFTAQVFRE